MNLGIYISDLSDTNQLESINNFVEQNYTNPNIYDISIFYDNISFNPANTKCGMFNSTDLWSFNGNVIVTSMDALNTSIKVINNINIFYYYGWENKINTLDLLKCLNLDNRINLICKNEKDVKEIYRLTGKGAVGISENFQNIIDLLIGHKDEYQSNNNNVYQTA